MSRFFELDNDNCRRAALNRGIVTMDSILDRNVSIELGSAVEPTVSIIIVSLNAVELLAATLAGLASLPRLNRTSFEVIIVDNASQEETRTLLRHVSGARIILNSSNLGFGGGCNLGASAAAGRYLLFLNPDIELMPGALDALVEAAESNEKVGIVGGRLLFPNSQIQEAGAFFKNDSQLTHPYLRGVTDPSRAEATYRHETGYVSGALLLIGRELFNILGGFDPIYSPAYFEDTDLCVRCARSGYSVLYEPTAVAIHFESATSKTRAEVEMLLEKNRTVFRERHAKWIFARGDSHTSDLERRNFAPDELRILYIDDEVPHKDSGSGLPRANDILSHLTALGYFVSVFPLHRGENEAYRKYRDLSRRIEILGGEYGEPLTEILEKRRGYYDILWVSRPHNIDLVVDMFDRSHEKLRNFVRSSIVFDAEAIFSVRWAQKTFLGAGVVYGNDVEAAIRHEIRNYQMADHVVFVNETEKQLCHRLGVVNARVLGHSLEVHPETPGFRQRSGLVFFGALLHIDAPNFDSLTWFKDNVWDLLRSRLGSDLTLTIVGPVSDQVRVSMAADGIVFVGRVPDLAPHADAARVLIAPTRYAAGIPHKVHEAASRGLPAVVTPLLAHQIGWSDGVGYMVADWQAPFEFADAIIELMRNENRWTETREAGYKALERDCSSFEFRRALRDICEWKLV